MTAAVTLFVLWQMFPSRIVRNTTPGPGDLTAHFGTAWYLQHHLLPHGRISGWTMEWFTGYPVLTFYFPLGSILIAVLGWLVPLNIALKVLATLGPLTLPAAAYAFGRLNGRDRLTSACFAVAVLPMLLEPLLHVPGGSIISAASSGEYGYGLSLSLGLVVVGLAGAGLRTGRHRALTACLLAANVLLHILPAAFAFIGIAGLVALRPSRAALRWALPVIGVAVALTGVWLVPFVALNRFTGGYTCERVGPVLTWLLPVGMAPVAVVAGLGAVIGVLAVAAGSRQKRDGLWTFMVLMAVLGAVTFALAPAGQVCNTRFLPIWFLWLSLLAGDALARLARAVDDRRKAAAHGRQLSTPFLARLLMPVVVFAVVLPGWASRVGPGVLLKAHAGATRFPGTVMAGYDTDDVHSGIGALSEALRTLGREHGCGRAHWERAKESDKVDDAALMFLVPYLTNGCIGVVRGLYIESSATSPYLDAVTERLSVEPLTNSEQPRAFDLVKGVADLRVLGARYFIAAHPGTQEAADRSPDLRPVATSAQGAHGSWKVYEVVPAVELVEPLRHTPVVVPGSGRSRLSWQRMAEAWFDGESRDVPLAAAGPDEWPRRKRPDQGVPNRSLPSTTVSGIRTSDDRISFRVSETGVPVLVKVSYFPNWRARGAKGPWRVAPNQMVVVPTSHTVTLRYERTAVEDAGLLLTLVGVGGLVVLRRRPPVEMPEPDMAPAEPAVRPNRPKAGTKKKSKRRTSRR